MKEYNVFVYYYFLLQNQKDKMTMLDELENQKKWTYLNDFSISSFHPQWL